MTNEELILQRLARVEEKLDGVIRIEEQLGAFAGTWDNLSDLSRDLSHLMDPVVKKVTDELVEVESGFQLEDVFALLKKLLPSLRYFTWSLEQMENFIDWWKDMEPLLKIAVPKLIDQLDLLEQHGAFRLLSKMTDLQNLKFLDQLTDVPLLVHLEASKPVGPMGLMFKMGSQECRQGLGVLVELTKALGKIKTQNGDRPEA